MYCYTASCLFILSSLSSTSLALGISVTCFHVGIRCTAFSLSLIKPRYYGGLNPVPHLVVLGPGCSDRPYSTLSPPRGRLPSTLFTCSRLLTCTSVFTTTTSPYYSVDIYTFLVLTTVSQQRAENPRLIHSITITISHGKALH